MTYIIHSGVLIFWAAYKRAMRHFHFGSLGYATLLTMYDILFGLGRPNIRYETWDLNLDTGW